MDSDANPDLLDDRDNMITEIWQTVQLNFDGPHLAN